MEFNDVRKDDDSLGLPEICDLYIRSGITLEIYKWKFDEQFKFMTRATIETTRQLCAKLSASSSVEPTAAQKIVLEKTFGHMATHAMAQISDAKASVSTENIVPLLCMANQTGKLNVEFVGGCVPVLNIVTTDQVTPQKVCVKIISGVPSYGDKVSASMLSLGMKTCLVATSIAVNAASMIAVSHKFSLDKSCAGHPFIPPNVYVPGSKDGRLTTGFSNVVMKRFQHTPASVYQLIADTAKNSHKLETWLNTYPKGALGVPKTDVLAVPRLNGRDFKDLSIPILKSYYEKGYNQLGKAKDYLKNTDVGYSGLNAPLKWRIPIEVVTGSPDQQGFKKSLTCVYYGAGGNRARAMMENRMLIDAYDLKVSPAPTKKVSGDDMKRLKIYTWKVKDIFTHQETKHNIFVSDVYIPSWKVEGSEDQNGHKFVSGIIKGVIQNGDLVTCKKLPPARLVKGFLPSVEEIPVYDGCYPFWMWRVCRPLTTEIIYLRVDNVGDVNDIRVVSDRIDIFKKNFGWFPGTRCELINNKLEFELFITRCYAFCCEELNFQQRRMASDPREVYASSHNRNWGLRSQDLPCLFVPRGMRGVGVNAVDKEANMFGIAVMKEQMVNDDYNDFMEQAHPEGEQVAQHHADNQHGGVQVQINDDDGAPIGFDDPEINLV